MAEEWIRGIKLVLKEGTTFDVYFWNGEVKRYDILWLADKFPQLNALKDRKLFLKGKLPGWGGIEWNDELDIGIETVYEDGINVTDEYDDIENVVIGYFIKEKRMDLRMSQQQLAEKTGIDQSDLSKIEKGNANPSTRTLKKIAKGLNCKLSLELH
jgi:DNA-binding XRE family transcriptional regulator